MRALTEVSPGACQAFSQMPIKVAASRGFSKQNILSKRKPDQPHHQFHIFCSQHPHQPHPLLSNSRQLPIMPKPRRNLQATAEETMTPPSSLTPTQSLARVVQAAGNNLYRVELPNSSTLTSDASKTLLVELPARFRSTIWIKRGGFVLVDTAAATERENKLDGEIVNVVRNEKEWRKEKYWPKEFVQRISYADEDDSDEEESNVGRMPPSDSEDE